MTSTAKIVLATPKNRSWDLLVVGVPKGDEGSFDWLPAASPLLEEAAKTGWTATSGALLEGPSDRKGRVVLSGLGPSDELDRPALRGWLRKTITAAGKRGIERLALALPSHAETNGTVAATRIVTAASAASYRFDRFRETEKPAVPNQVALLAPPGEEKAYKQGLAVGRAVATGAEVTRDLGNTPPNVATPEWMATQTRKLAERYGGKVEVLGPKTLQRRGMGGISQVGAGSVNTPRMVRWRRGDGGPKVALVGKGITFDTGGISIKPSQSMHEMKFDKCGACTVMGAMVAAAELDLDARLEAYLPFAENMPDAAAYRPGDIVTCYGGKTVEILNTDAEGRMILADALGWASEGKPDHIVELSTLTGATVVALGSIGAALYTPEDELATALLAAADRSYELLWRMPLWSEMGESLKGNHADLRNVGERWGGANFAAAFLGEFVDGVDSWAHLDIAGTAYSEKEVSHGQTGATGYGVGLLTSWLRDLTGARDQT